RLECATASARGQPLASEGAILASITIMSIAAANQRRGRERDICDIRTDTRLVAKLCHCGGGDGTGRACAVGNTESGSSGSLRRGVVSFRSSHPVAEPLPGLRSLPIPLQGSTLRLRCRHE